MGMRMRDRQDLGIIMIILASCEELRAGVSSPSV